MEKLELSFYECEHQGDLDTYIKDIVDCGGKIIAQVVNPEAETGHVVVHVEDKKAFWTLFKETYAYDFLN